jgi:electron transport complex protein RnfE
MAGLILPFIIVCGNSLRNAVGLSIEFAFIHLVTIVAALVFLRRLPDKAKLPATLAVSTAAMVFSRFLVVYFIPDLINSAGVYLYLMSVNGMTVFSALEIERIRSANFTLRRRRRFLLRSAFEAAISVVFFAVLIFFVSFVREYFAFGTLWGIPVISPVKLTALSLPMGGFIFIGLVLAGGRFLNRTIDRATVRSQIRSDEKFAEIRLEEEDR